MTDEFIVAACVPRSAHASGTLEHADAVLAAHPDVAVADIYAAAILGDSPTVRRLLADDRGRARARGGPYDWDALTYLCFSRYLRLRGSDGFVRAAEALLDGGADPNTGFFETAHESEPTFESSAVRRRRCCSPRWADTATTRAWRGPEPGRRGRISRAGGLRQRGDAGGGAEWPVGE